MAKVSVLCVMLMVLLPLQVYGWWDTGHMLVAQIAWKYLNQTSTPTATLNAIENAVNSLVTYANNSNTFVTSACWMDDIKARDYNQMDNWHYINLPYCFGFNDTLPTDACYQVSVDSLIASSVSYNTDDALAIINGAITTLRSPDARGFERGLALRNLIHITGDIHQPLHATTMYTPSLPGGDSGGNLFYLTNMTLAGTGKLHGFWDSGATMLNNSITRPLSPAAAEYLSNTADQIMAFSANITANATWKNVTEWGMESYYLAIEYAYNITNNTHPSQEYIDAAWIIVQQRIGLAGYRLAQVLNQIKWCSDALTNCPVESPAPSTDERWIIVAIVLGVVLGGSVLANVVLTYSVCKRRARDDEEKKPLNR